MRVLRYALSEAVVSLRRSGRSAVLAVTTITIAFVTLGSFLLVTTNAQRVVGRWAEAAELSVYLHDDADDGARAALTEVIRAHEAVAGIEFVSKADALARFQAEFPELADVASPGDRNPFPASLEVRLRRDAATVDAAEDLAARLVDRPDVADVRFDRAWLGRLQALVDAARATGLIVAGVLVLGAGFTVAAVVRLSLHARRDEVEIMQLVGAPFGFVGGPFIAEGTLQGGAGAGLALLVVWGLHAGLLAAAGADLGGLLPGADWRFLTVAEAASLVGAGLGVGALAGGVAARAAR